MSLNVIYTGGSSTLMNSNCVVVKRKPGPLNVNNISDYLSTYSIDEIKEGILRPVGEDEFYIYDLNDAKPIVYDLLIYISGNISFDEGFASNNLEGIGYIELVEMGLATVETHEVIKINYTIIEGQIFNTRLVLDYTSSQINNRDYITLESNNPYRTYSRNVINSFQWGVDTCNAIESFGSRKIAPAHKGYLHRGRYYEMPSLNLNLNNDNHQVVNMRVQPWNNNYWLEVTYSNKTTILHNISNLPSSGTPLIQLVNGSSTKLINWQFANSVIINPRNICYKLSTLGNWFVVRTGLSTEDMLNDIYRDRILQNTEVGRNLEFSNPNFVYSVQGYNLPKWCLTKAIVDKMDSMNTVGTSSVITNTVWEHSILKSYKVVETDMDCIVINEYNNNVNINRAYFSDKTSFIIPANSKFRILGNGELMVQTLTGFLIYSGSANKVTDVKSIFDLTEFLFSTYDRVITPTPITYDNVVIHGGKFYILTNSNILR